MNAISSSLRVFNRKEIWGWPLFWFALPVYFLLSFFFDVFLAQSWRIEWLYIAVFSMGAVTLLAIFFRHFFVNRFFLNRSAGLFNVIAIAALGAVKNVLVGELSVLWGLVTSVDWAFRIYGGAGLSIGVLLGFVYVLGARVDHNSTMAALEASRAQLVRHRAEAEDLLAREQKDLLRQTQSSLLPRLDEIQKSLAGSAEPIKVVESLRELIQTRVRPLSKSLSQAAENLTLASAPAPVEKPKSKMFQNSFLLRPIIAPGQMFLMILLGNWFLSYVILGIVAANWSLLYSCASWAIIAGIKVLIPASYRLNRSAGISLLFFIGFVSSNPVYWLLKEFSDNLQEDLLLLLVVLNVIGSVVGFAYSKSLELDRIEAVNQMQRDNNQLAREVALFDQQVWIARRSWSFVVHGTVQAALTAAITRLSASSQPEQYQVDLALQDLERATNALSKTPEINVDLNQALQNIASTWSGICKVRFNLTERASRALQKDQNARMCVNEICKEAVSNAVRHGEAKNISFEIDRSSDEILFITASNDGRALDKSAIPGVGSKMFDELTIGWSLQTNRGAQQTVLQAQLPLSPRGASS
jgi:signal transduction histidine kinase